MLRPARRNQPVFQSPTYFELTEDAWLCVRPSGTEPKIKLYFGVVGKDLADADEKSEKLAVIVKDLLNQLG